MSGREAGIAKYWMRLLEFQTPALYLCTRTCQEIDGVVSLDAPIEWLGAELEAAIEAQRPEGCLPRTRSLILSLRPQGTQFTYLIEPIGKLERQNVGWLQRLQQTDQEQAGVLAHYANGYWSGGECPEARNEPWEYRAVSVRIARRVGRSGRYLGGGNDR